MLPTRVELERRVAELMGLWRVPPAPAVTVVWNARLRSTAGRAFPAAGRIELNPTLLGDHRSEIPVVLTHEAAHVAAHRLFGAAASAHGRHWRGLMRLAGLPPEVMHDLPVNRRHRRRDYLYLRVCDNCGDRRLGRTVRYQACRCGSRDRWLVLRAPAGASGFHALRSLSLSEVRRRCAPASAGARTERQARAGRRDRTGPANPARRSAEGHSADKG